MDRCRAFLGRGDERRSRRAPARRDRRLPPLPLLLAALAVLGLAAAALGRPGERRGGHASSPVRLEPVPTVQTYPPGRLPASEFRLAGLDGGTVDLAAYRGRPLLVNFWASWCKPCAKEFPLLRATRERHRADGLEVIGVLATSDSPAKARAFARRNGATWPVGIDKGAAPAGETTVAYGVAGLPETFFVRRDGSLAARQLGELTEQGLRQHLGSILVR